MWDPPEVTYREASLRENWGGSGGAYALTAGALNYLLTSNNALHRPAVLTGFQHAVGGSKCAFY
jgi:hypothetical protein